MALALLAAACGGTATPSYAIPGSGTALLATLSAGVEPATVWLAGDSTGDARDEWFCMSLDWLADRYPAYSLSQVSWNDDLQSWQPRLGAAGRECPPRFGTAGDRYVMSSASAYPVVRDAPALRTAGDLDVRAKIAPDDWAAPATQTVVAKYGQAGERSWRLLLKQDRLVAERSLDGTATDSVASSLDLPFQNGSPGWVRFTLDADDGAGSAVLAFFVSADGVTWAPLGHPARVPAGAPFAATHDVEIGTHTSGADPLVGRDYFLEIRDGIDGRDVVALDMDAVGSAPALTDLLGNTVELVGAPTVGGSPGIIAYNGSVAGKSVAYAADPSRLQRLTPAQPDVAFLSYGHNEGTAISMRAPYEQVLDALEHRWPRARLVVVGQNPQRRPRSAEQIAAHAARVADLAALAQRHRLNYLDVLTPMSAAPERYVGDDGVHPTPAGDQLWRDLTVALLQRPGIG